MSDRRDQKHQWYSSFDAKRMVVVLEEVDTGKDELEDIEIPVQFAVCDTCEGRGSHVNPSIDSHGLTREDFDDDPDFAEDYFEGRYDVPCAECHGRNVVPVIADNATPAERQYAEAAMDALYQNNRERNYEQRMGL